VQGITAGLKVQAGDLDFLNASVMPSTQTGSGRVGHEELLSWIKQNSSFAVSYSPSASSTSSSEGGED
jgi:hypothetical protein